MVTNKQRDDLLQVACEVRKNAYARYSNYPVGAAVLSDDGRIFSGANVENASFGLTMCAERAAIFSAVSQGAERINALAVCTGNIGTPCGACRQVLVEFAGDIPVWLTDDKGNVRQTSLYKLIPDHFGPEHLRPV